MPAKSLLRLHARSSRFSAVCQAAAEHTYPARQRKHLNVCEKVYQLGFAKRACTAIMRAATGRCRSGRTGRIRNPLNWRQFLGFKSLSSRHI